MGLRFKIANLIMGDLLRNYLAVGVRLPLVNVLEYSKYHQLGAYTESQIEEAIKTIDEIFEI